MTNNEVFEKVFTIKTSTGSNQLKTGTITIQIMQSSTQQNFETITISGK